MHLSVIVALYCFSWPLQLFYTPICNVCIQQLRLLRTVSDLLIARAARQYFIAWLAERLDAGLFGIAFSLSPFPLYILVVGGCYSLACLQSFRPILFASCCFIPLFQWFHYYCYYCYYYFTLVYFDWLPLNVFQCDWCPC